MTLHITANAAGSSNPTPIPAADGSLMNGDFTITGQSGAGDIGDGKDERTTWAFGFSGHPDFADFSDTRPLLAARLTLTLTPRASLVTTDRVLIEGLPPIVAPEIQSLPVGQTRTIQLDLLDRPGYDSDSILAAMAGGVLKMEFRDDCVVSYAQLDLKQVSSVGIEYAAKYVCIDDPQTLEEAPSLVAPGTYWTAINIHNPTPHEVRVYWKVAGAGPDGQCGRMHGFFPMNLGPDCATRIDCSTIAARVGLDPTTIDGFVVIRSGVELDVVAVYTAAGPDGAVGNLDVERVPPRYGCWKDLRPLDVIDV